MSCILCMSIGILSMSADLRTPLRRCVGPLRRSAEGGPRICGGVHITPSFFWNTMVYQGHIARPLLWNTMVHQEHIAHSPFQYHSFDRALLFLLCQQFSRVNQKQSHTGSFSPILPTHHQAFTTSVSAHTIE